MRRKPLRKLIAVYLLALGWCACAGAKTNLLVIFTDDQTYRAIGYNNDQIATPHLDALAAKGLIFNHAYVASPICAASRASMMTGVYPQQHGLIALNRKGFAPFLADGDRAAQTLPRQLRDAGYHCAFWGKSHLGKPQAYGFAEGAETGPYNDVDTFRHAEAFLDRAAARDKPFFLWLAPHQPHVPLKPAQQWLDLYDESSIKLDPNFREQPTADDVNNQGRAGQAYYRDSGYRNNWQNLPAGPPRTPAVMRRFVKAYYATISHLDSQIGQLVVRLDQLGLADNTVIFFLSDNGYHLGNHGLGNKITMHEESVRVPMFVTGPGIAKPGSRSDALVSSLDVYSTLLALAGVSPPAHAMGKSLLPLFQDPDTTVRQVVFSECTGVGGKPGEGHRMARGPHWKYVLSDANQRYLFNQHTDAYEQQNLLEKPSPEQAPALHSLEAAMHNWMEAIGDRPHPKN